MKLLNLSLIIALVVVPSVFGIFKMPTEMGLAIGAIIVALFFTNIEKFKRFKGAGFEAELRTAVDKAYAAIEELKEFALSLAAPIVDELAISGRIMQFIPLSHKLDRVEKITETLRKLGATEQEVQEVCSTIYQRVVNDHIRNALGSLKTANTGSAAIFHGLDDWKATDGWDKNRLEEFIVEHGLTKDENTSEWLSDLDYFIENRKLRREDKWQS